MPSCDANHAVSRVTDRVDVHLLARWPRRLRTWLRIAAEVIATGGLVAFAWFDRGVIVQSVTVLKRADWNWLILAVALQWLSMLGFGRTQLTLLRAAGVRVSIPSMVATTFAGNAISVSLPLIGPGVGTAFAFGRFRQVAGDATSAGSTLLISGLISNLVWAVLLATGAVVSGIPAATVPGLLGGGAILVATVIALLALRRQRLRDFVTREVTRLVQLVQRLTGRPVGDAGALTNTVVNRLTTFRMSPRRWVQTVGYSFLNWLASVGCLVAAISTVGANVPWTKVLLVYCAGAAASSFNLTPGGLGVVEAVLAGGLAAAGMKSSAALGSVIIFRLLSFWLPIFVGWTIYARLRQHNRRDMRR
jgi:uncharacterized protein (TIRG00374 family)